VLPTRFAICEKTDCSRLRDVRLSDNGGSLLISFGERGPPRGDGRTDRPSINSRRSPPPTCFYWLSRELFSFYPGGTGIREKASFCGCQYFSKHYLFLIAPYLVVSSAPCWKSILISCFLTIPKMFVFTRQLIDSLISFL